MRVGTSRHRLYDVGLNAGEYYLAIASADSGKGKYNTEYELICMHIA